MATASSSIAAAENRLESAYFGLEDMEKRPKRFQSGLMNAVVFARMVTLSLQNMRNDVPGWQEWYALEQEKMKDDASMKFFIELRNTIEKTVSETVSMSFRLSSFSTSDLDKYKPAPPGATSFVMGSAKHGGASGWMIEAADGSTELYAVDIPESMGKATMHFINAPENLAGEDVREIVRDHLDKLKALVQAAKQKFS